MGCRIVQIERSEIWTSAAKVVANQYKYVILSKHMIYLPPHRIKILEALGAIADNRIKENKVYSSSGNKFYEVNYKENKIYSNDNSSYWQNKLGYPCIAYLMSIKKLSYNNEYANALKGIKWKDLNQLHKNDFDKTENYILNLRKDKIHVEKLNEYINKVLEEIKDLNLELLEPKTKPPEGY